MWQAMQQSVSKQAGDEPVSEVSIDDHKMISDRVICAVVKVMMSMNSVVLLSSSITTSNMNYRTTNTCAENQCFSIPRHLQLQLPTAAYLSKIITLPAICCLISLNRGTKMATLVILSNIRNIS